MARKPKKSQTKEAETAVPQQTVAQTAEKPPVKGEHLLTGFVPDKK